MPKKMKGCKTSEGTQSDEGAPGEHFVKKSLKRNKVVVFVASEDPFSLRALSALRRSGVKGKLMSNVSVTGHELEEAIRDYFLEVSGARSLPRVFIDGKFIGGASDLEYLEMTGQLRTILKQAKCFKKPI